MAVRSKTRPSARTAPLRSRRPPRVEVRHDLTEPESGPPLVPEHTPDLRERKRQGRALREKTPREEHARWEPPADRPDPIALLEASYRGRLSSLIPIRHARMGENPFAFLRGSALLMANDLAHTPHTGIKVQACGDAHLDNFGLYATPERNLVFDVNDFDETLPAPWEWDLKRLVTSIWVVGRCNGAKEPQCEEAVAACVSSYRRWMKKMSRWSFLQVCYARVDAEAVLEMIERQERGSAEKTLAEVHRKTHLSTLPKLTELHEGRRRIIHDPPRIERIPRDHAEELAEVLQLMSGGYLSSLRGDRSTLVRRYQTVDVARKAGGVGSVGMRCYVALLFGAHEEDPLFLQVKEAGPSVLEPYAGKSTCANAGQRVVEGQRLMQAASDIFLGWFQVGGHDFYVRQLRDMKGSIDVDDLSPDGLREYGSLCAWALAQAHARGGDAAMLRGYLGGRSEAFDEALCRFARAYADQNEQDFTLFQKAVREGRLQAHEA